MNPYTPLSFYVSHGCLTASEHSEYPSHSSTNAFLCIGATVDRSTNTTHLVIKLGKQPTRGAIASLSLPSVKQLQQYITTSTPHKSFSCELTGDAITPHNTSDNISLLPPAGALLDNNTEVTLTVSPATVDNSSGFEFTAESDGHTSAKLLLTPTQTTHLIQLIEPYAAGTVDYTTHNNTLPSIVEPDGSEPDYPIYKTILSQAPALGYPPNTTERISAFFKNANPEDVL